LGNRRVKNVYIKKNSRCLQEKGKINDSLATFSRHVGDVALYLDTTGLYCHLQFWGYGRAAVHSGVGFSQLCTPLYRT